MAKGVNDYKLGPGFTVCLITTVPQKVFISFVWRRAAGMAGHVGHLGVELTHSKRRSGSLHERKRLPPRSSHTARQRPKHRTHVGKHLLGADLSIQYMYKSGPTRGPWFMKSWTSHDSSWFELWTAIPFLFFIFYLYFKLFRMNNFYFFYMFLKLKPIKNWQLIIRFLPIRACFLIVSSYFSNSSRLVQLKNMLSRF